MVQTPRQFTFEDYLAYEDDTDNRYELIDGELVPLPPESELNGWIAEWLRDEFVNFIFRRLVRVNAYEVQVLGNPQNRYPDLVVLQDVHLQLTRDRQTITLDMPSPRLVVEVVSPYKNRQEENYRRDYQAKRVQYKTRGIPEYWIVDPTERQIVVLQLEAGKYVETVFRGDSRIVSRTFPELELSAQQVFDAI